MLAGLYIDVCNSITKILSERTLPLITGRALKYVPPNRPPKQAWLQSLKSINDQKLGIIDLHPQLFGAFPRYVPLMHCMIQLFIYIYFNHKQIVHAFLYVYMSEQIMSKCAWLVEHP